MDAPTLLLVPPTPLRFDSPQDIQEHPQQRSKLARKGSARDSSENAIFSIYSMYGDEQNARASTSWAADPPSLAGNPSHDRTHSKDTSRTESLKLPDTSGRPSSFFPPDGYEDSDLAYYSPEIPDPDPHMPPAPTSRDKHRQYSGGIVGTDSSPRGSVATTSSARPPSSYATPSSLRANSDLFDDSRLANSELRTSDLSASSYTPGLSQSKEFTRSPSPHSRRSSRSSPIPRKLSQRSIRQLPPLPTSAHTTPSPTPPRQASPSITLLTPKHSNKVYGKHPLPAAGSPSSKVSLVPSEGEDMDAFHVRNTYAELEASGVKGDGYEEGIERTRARIGTSRKSQLQADAALGDGKEKTRELDAKEIQVLKSVDRYGFFTIPSHDRLVRLDSAPLLKRIGPTTAGPLTNTPNATSINSLPPVSVPPKESSRIAKWTRMLQPQKREHGGNVETWYVRPSKESKLRERVYKGIPDRWRRAAWDLLMSKYSGIGPRGLEKLGEDYRDCLDKPSTYDIQIDLDVPRTISGHIMFRTRYGAGQRSLFHVLHSFSLRCPSCGYVQGMGPIAATLLCYFEPERVYASLVLLHDAYKMHDVFSPGFPGLLEAIYIQERITETMMPGVYAAFKKHMISTTSYATKWYITLFANSVPFQTQLRLWDAFLLEGYDVFIAIAVAIVWVYRDLITSSSANFETVLSLLSSFFVPESDDSLMSWIEMTLSDRKLRANMSKWRQDWKGLVATGKDGTALL
ncbi:rab-GTPase-TBC domain-containing protein [Crassisporium funariophilum]|nr:rab-GTPase-TBC domain-containing protein [Crassisporium funariophilum]